MAHEHSYPAILGYVTRFEIRKVFEAPDAARFDVEIVLAPEWRESSPTTKVQFIDVRDVRYGGPHEGIALGNYLCLSISNVSAAQWDGIRYEVTNVEHGCALSLYCRAFEILGSGEGQP